MKKLGITGWGALLASLLTPDSSFSQPGAPKLLTGSQERYLHYASDGTYRANTERSRDRKARRFGEVSARQQRTDRKLRNACARLARDLAAEYRRLQGEPALKPSAEIA